MRRMCVFLSTALIVASSAVANAANFQNDTSECRSLLDAQDYAQALSICTQAAETGDAAAQSNLSMMYSFGWGVAKDKVEAIKWLRASAEQRYPPAQYALSSEFAAGTNVTQDYKEAFRLLSDAGKQGFVLAQMQLGRMYEAGYPRLEINQDISTAITWYRQAAEQCDICQYELGRIYYLGSGVDKDHTEAAKYFKKAAEGGLPKAQMQLAFRYLNGEGVPKNNIDAYMWLYIAAKLGEPIAKDTLPPLSRKMSRSEIADAKTLADAATAKFIINTNLLCALYNQFCGK